MKYAEIALSLPIDKTFDYLVPASLSDQCEAGKRAWVPFGQRRMPGIIVGLTDKPGDVQADKLRAIESIIDDTPVISGEIIKLTRWIADYYCTSWGKALDAAIPSPLKKGKISVKRRGAVDETVYERSGNLKLTQEQAAALKEVSKSICAKEHRVFLLHGITSSGKTEVYLQAIDQVLQKGGTAIVLVPEISLTPQAVERFSSRFGDKVAVVHSRVTGGERFDVWKAIKDGKAKVVVGPRSAIFSPLKNIGIIVVDEEHETSYKQDDAPRYHARDTAIKLAEIVGCPVILGSATPSLEAYRMALEGRYSLLELTKRIDDRPLPEVRIIDMKKELERRKRVTVLSGFLMDRIEKALIKKGQMMLFLNRRGFSTYIMCKKCGHTMKCTKCDAVMVYHSAKRELLCHYCSHKAEPPKVCPECRSGYLRFAGKGTEKVESEVHKILPGARIERMDTDTMRKKGAHEAILSRMKNGLIDVLVGTQMIAKGHDFPQVTLVGVVAADVSLNLPDFRSGERTFCLLTQVAGRAGRGENPGEVIIQTYAPTHYAIVDAAKHDYASFSKKELEFRRKLGFPPYGHLVKVTLKGANEKGSRSAAEDLAKILKNGLKSDGEVIGPTPGIIPRIRNQYIWNILIKTLEPGLVSRRLKEMLGSSARVKGATVAIDVDPISL